MFSDSTNGGYYWTYTMPASPLLQSQSRVEGLHQPVEPNTGWLVSWRGQWQILEKEKESEVHLDEKLQQSLRKAGLKEGRGDTAYLSPSQ